MPKTQEGGRGDAETIQKTILRRTALPHLLSCLGSVVRGRGREGIGGQGLSFPFIYYSSQNPQVQAGGSCQFYPAVYPCRIVMYIGSSRCSSIIFMIFLLPAYPPADATIATSRSPIGQLEFTLFRFYDTCGLNCKTILILDLYILLLHCQSSHY